MRVGGDVIERSRAHLRIRCDFDGCERLFSPRPPVADSAPDGMYLVAAGVALRTRAHLHGWRYTPALGADGQLQLDARGAAFMPRMADLCPRHPK